MTKIENKISILEKILKTAIWVSTIMAMFIPFIVYNKGFFPFVGAKSIFFMAFAQIAFASWMILAIINPKYRPKINPLIIIVFLYLLVFGLATAFGLDPTRSFWSKFERMTGFLMQLHLGAFFLALSNTFKKKSDWNSIFLVSTFFSTLMSIYFLCVKYGINVFNTLLKYSTWGGVTLGNSSFLATYLMFNCFLIIYLISQFAKDSNRKIFSWEEISKSGWLFWLSSAGIVAWCVFTLKQTGIYFSIFLVFLTIALAMLSFLSHRIYLFLIFILNFWALFYSGGRAALASFFGGLAIIFLLWLAFNHKNVQIRKIGKITIVVFAIFSIWFLSSILEDNSYLSNEFIKSGGGARLLIWKNIIPAIWQKPLLGYGPENFELVFYKYFNPKLFLVEYGGEVWFDRAHNIIIDTLISTGILGLLSYLSLFLGTSYLLWKKYNKDNQYFWEFSIISGLLAAYFVQNLTVFDMVTSYMMFFLVLAFAGSLINQNDQENISEKEDISPTKVFGIILVIAMFGSWIYNFAVLPYKSNSAIVQLLQENNPNQRIILYKEGNKSHIGFYQQRDYLCETVNNIMQSNQYNAQQKALFKEEADMFIQEHQKTISEAPTDYRAYIRLGYMLISYGIAYDPSKINEAIDVFQKAFELSPNNPQSYWGLSQARIMIGEIDESFRLIDKAAELEPTLERTYIIGIDYAKALKKIDYVVKYAQMGWDASLAHIKNVPGVANFYDNAIYFGGLLGKTNEVYDVINKAISDTGNSNLGFFKTGMEFARVLKNQDKLMSYALQGLQAAEKKIDDKKIEKTKNDFDLAIFFAGTLNDMQKVNDLVEKAIKYNPDWTADYQKMFASGSAPIIPTSSKK